MKVSGSKYIFLVLYVNDIFLTAKDTDLLVETKQLLFNHFDMKDLGEASYVLGIQMLRDRPSGILRLCQQTYIEHILNGFNIQSCSSSKASIVKGDRFSKGQFVTPIFWSDLIGGFQLVPGSLFNSFYSLFIFLFFF